MLKALLTSTVIVLSTSLAMAQGTPAKPNPADAPATKAYTQSMQKMDDDMKAMAPTGDPSMDFVMMMKPHHQAAVEMAQAYLKYGNDPKLKRMAKNIIASQKKEIGEMNAWEKKHGM